MNKFVISFIALLTFVPMIAFASPIIRTGDSVTVEQGQIVEGDFYGVGGVAALSGDIHGDAFLTGGTVTVNAPVSQDLMIVSGTVQIHAPIGDDLRVLGGDVTVGGDVSGDVVVIGGVLHVLSTATIQGDIIFYGGELVLEGATKGSVYGGAQTARINASVGGDINLRAPQGLTLGDRAEVLGNIQYVSSKDLVRSQNAVVVGKIQEERMPVQSFSFQALLIPLLMLLFAALTLHLILRKHLQSFFEKTYSVYGKEGLIGLAVFLGTPFVAILLMLSVVGFFVGLFLILLYVALLIVSYVIAGMLLGSLLMQLYTKKRTVSFMTVVLGVVALQIIVLIPFLGPLCIFAGILVILGSIALRIYHYAA